MLIQLHLGWFLTPFSLINHLSAKTVSHRWSTAKTLSSITCPAELPGSLNKNLINIEPNLLHNGEATTKQCPQTKLLGWQGMEAATLIASSTWPSLSRKKIDIASITFQFRKDKLRTVSSFSRNVWRPLSDNREWLQAHRRPRNVQELGCKLTKPLHSEWDDIFGNHLVKKRLSLCQNSHI